MYREERLERAGKIIEREFGLHYEGKRLNDLERALSNCAKSITGEEDPEVIIKEILSTGKITDRLRTPLSTFLTINETYFFRESPAISLFRDVIIPGIYNKGEECIIWSAGCSSGEEPYTLAILIKEHPLDISKLVKIIATDISDSAIKKAREGIYSEWSFRETPVIIKNKYFTANERHWSISQEIKKMVHFKNMNLLEDPFPLFTGKTGVVDVIFCRNVLMYFNGKTIKQLSNKFMELLLPDGWLITGQVELNDEYFVGFGKVNHSGGIFYRKVSNLNLENTQNEVINKRGEQRKRLPRVASISTSLRRQKPKLNIAEVHTKKEIDTLTPDNLFISGNYSQCIEECRRILTKKEDNHIELILAKSLANIGGYEEAAGIVEKLIYSGYKEDDIYYLYGSLLKESGDNDNAAEAFRKQLYLHPEHMMANIMLGSIMSLKGKGDFSVRYLRKAAQILNNMKPGQQIEGSGGLTRERVAEMVDALIKREMLKE